MSNATDNLMLRGQHGKFGNQLILRTFKNGQTYMSNIHDYRNAVWSVAQVKNRVKFRMAVKWAKKVFKDEKALRYYKKKARGNLTAYNVAIGDYMKDQQLTVDMSMGEGRLVFNMLHKFGASSMNVCVYGPNSYMIERGNGKLTNQGLGWEYKVRTTTHEIKPEEVEVTIFRGPVEYKHTFQLNSGFK
jgi:hypothetical protein